MIQTLRGNTGIQPGEVWLELENRANASNLTGQSNGALKRMNKSVELGTTKIP
jgi:hypothetical protein